MKTYIQYLNLGLLLLFLLPLLSCKKKAPEGFSADFTAQFNNGGMAPDTAVFSAQYPDADSYEWSLENITKSGKQITQIFTTAGSFNMKLTVKSGKHSKTQSQQYPVENFPPGGSAMTIIQGNGEVGTIGVDGASPFLVPIDTIDPGGIGGMDYDDNTKQLYYTSSIIRSFPNGAERKVIFSDDQLTQDEVRIVDLAVAPDDQRIYFVIEIIPAGGLIASVDLNGNDRINESPTSFPNILDITLDEENKRVYFTSNDLTSIKFAALQDISTFYSNQSVKYAIVFDNMTRWLYFVEDVDFDKIYEIMRVRPDDYNPDLPDTWPEVVVEDASIEPILGLDVLESKQHLFWSDSRDNVIKRLDLTNTQGTPEVIFTGVTNPRALAVSNFDK